MRRGMSGCGALTDGLMDVGPGGCPEDRIGTFLTYTHTNTTTEAGVHAVKMTKCAVCLMEAFLFADGSHQEIFMHHLWEDVWPEVQSAAPCPGRSRG